MDKVIEILSLKDYLSSTDYIILKFVEGQITQEEFEKVKLEREKARKRIKELEGK